jgi:hypothetical protein
VHQFAPLVEPSRIRIPAFGTLWVGASASGIEQMKVAGAADPVTGRAIYCRTGMKTFNKCSQTVESTTVKICWGTGLCSGSIYIAYVDPNGANTVAGDSGAPLYLPSGGLAYIRGMHTGLNGAATGFCKIGSNPCPTMHDQMVAHRWTTIANTLGVTIVTN